MILLIVTVLMATTTTKIQIQIVIMAMLKYFNLKIYLICFRRVWGEVYSMRSVGFPEM